MQPGEKQLGEMQLGEMQHFNTTPLGEMQPGEIQFGEMQLSPPDNLMRLLSWDIMRPHVIFIRLFLKWLFHPTLILRFELKHRPWWLYNFLSPMITPTREELMIPFWCSWSIEIYVGTLGMHLRAVCNEDWERRSCYSMPITHHLRVN